MVEDHQFSVSFSDLIPVGCGAEKDQNIETIRAAEFGLILLDYWRKRRRKEPGEFVIVKLRT